MKFVNWILRSLLLCVLALFVGLVVAGTYQSWRHPGVQTATPETGLVFLCSVFAVFLVCALSYLTIARRKRNRRQSLQATPRT